MRGLRAARKEDGAAKDGRDGDTGRRFERFEGFEGFEEKGHTIWREQINGRFGALSDIFTRIF